MQLASSSDQKPEVIVQNEFPNALNRLCSQLLQSPCIHVDILKQRTHSVFAAINKLKMARQTETEWQITDDGIKLYSPSHIFDIPSNQIPSSGMFHRKLNSHRQI